MYSKLKKNFLKEDPSEILLGQSLDSLETITNKRNYLGPWFCFRLPTFTSLSPFFFILGIILLSFSFFFFNFNLKYISFQLDSEFRQTLKYYGVNVGTLLFIFGLYLHQNVMLLYKLKVLTELHSFMCTYTYITKYLPLFLPLYIFLSLSPPPLLMSNNIIIFLTSPPQKNHLQYFPNICSSHFLSHFSSHPIFTSSILQLSLLLHILLPLCDFYL